MNRLPQNVSSASSSFNRRKSLKGVPNLPEDIPQNDDEAEREQRRRDSGKFGQLAGKRVSLGGIAELSASELVAQYTNCMRLSAENKINHKNAFSLPLIDCMKLLLKKKDEQMNNFQVVGCTLDASAKIYASRVDRVHMDGMSFARGLGSRARDLVSSKDDASGEDDALEENADIVKKKKSKKRRKLSRDTSKINISLDAAEPDPTYVVLSKHFSNCQPSFISFIPHLKMVGDSSKIFVDMKRPFLYKEEETTQYEETDVPFECDADGSYEIVVSPFREIMARDNEEIDYDSLLCTASLDDTLCTIDDPKDNEMNDFMSEPVCEDVILNGDNANEGLSVQKDISAWKGDCDMEVDATRAVCQARAGPRERVVDLQQAILKEVKGGSNLEYSYMNLDRILFAGPAHWGPLPVSKAKEKNSAMAERNKRKEKKVMTFDIRHLQEVDIPASRGCTLTRNYMDKNWTVDKVTNPADLHLDPKKLLRYFNRPRCYVSMIASQETPSILPEEEDEDINDYDYDNLNDSQQFCPAPMAPESDAETDALNSNPNPNFADDIEPSVDVHSCAPNQAVSDAWSMVDPPNKVARIAVPYAQHAKRVDMKMLKAAIWSVLSDDDKQYSEVTSGSTLKERKSLNNIKNKNSQNPSRSSSMTRKVEFSEMERSVMKIVPTDMAQELTMPLIFTALLHLANERVLTLSSLEDHSDVIIAQDSGAESFVRHLQTREFV